MPNRTRLSEVPLPGPYRPPTGWGWAPGCLWAGVSYLPRACRRGVAGAGAVSGLLPLAAPSTSALQWLCPGGRGSEGERVFEKPPPLAAGTSRRAHHPRFGAHPVSARFSKQAKEPQNSDPALTRLRDRLKSRSEPGVLPKGRGRRSSRAPPRSSRSANTRSWIPRGTARAAAAMFSGAEEGPPGAGGRKGPAGCPRRAWAGAALRAELLGQPGATELRLGCVETRGLAVMCAPRFSISATPLSQFLLGGGIPTAIGR